LPLVLHNSHQQGFARLKSKVFSHLSVNSRLLGQAKIRQINI
jgi:hypothetical protein